MQLGMNGKGEAVPFEWKKLSETEKIERMRSIVKANQVHVDNLERIIEMLLEHKHSDGKVVSEIRHGGGLQGRLNSAEEYF